MSKRVIEPNTTLYPVGVALVTTGGERPNVFTCNRLASCSAEPPRISLSIRKNRYSYDLMRASREFVVNIPGQNQSVVSDYIGVVSGRDEDKIAIAHLRLESARSVKTPLLANCPVNIECIVERELDLDSHALFIGLVQVVHAEESVLDANGDVDIVRATSIVYGCGTVRERPTANVRVNELRRLVQLA